MKEIQFWWVSASDSCVFPGMLMQEVLLTMYFLHASLNVSNQLRFNWYYDNDLLSLRHFIIELIEKLLESSKFLQTLILTRKKKGILIFFHSKNCVSDGRYISENCVCFFELPTRET